MRVEYASAKTFADIFQVIKKTVPEAVLVFNEKGMRMSTLDPSRVMYIDLFINKSAFTEYEVEGTVELPINIDDFVKVIKRGKKKDRLVLKHSGDNFIEIEFQGTAKRKFRLPLISVDKIEFIDSIDLPFTAKIVVTGGIMKDIIRDIKLISDSVKLIATKEDNIPKFIMKAESEISEYTMELDETYEGLYSIEIQEEASATYGIEYFSVPFSKVGASDEVEINFGNEIPVQIIWRPGIDIEVKFLIAPRAED